MGKLDMKLFGQAIKAAGIGAVLMLSVSAGHAQSGPFVGFDGAWSGNGTVSLSDGTTERIRCKADYKVNGSGLGLKQSLHCASDSYKFDLSTDVTSQGNRISGNWSEASRNLFGNLQGTAGGGQIEALVEASGFSASFARPAVPRSRYDRLINHVAVGRSMKRSATRARAAKERGSQLSSRR